MTVTAISSSAMMIAILNLYAAMAIMTVLIAAMNRIVPPPIHIPHTDHLLILALSIPAPMVNVTAKMNVATVSPSVTMAPMNLIVS